MAVNVIEQCKISPPSGSISPTSLPLTIFDTIWLPIPPVQRLFFYEFHHPKAYFMETILPNIKHSLSLTLQHFFPLCGHLACPHASSNPEVQYVDGDFVSLIVAESDYDFDTLVDSSNVRAANAFYPLAPKLLHNHALTAFQVTLFPNRGICIGIAYNHVVADGRSLLHFMKSWASLCKLEGKENTSLPPPYYDRSIVNNPSWVDTVCLIYKKISEIPRETFLISHGDLMDKLVLATFVMTPRSIKILRQWVLSRLDNKTLHLSTFVLTCAYVWVCLIKAEWEKKDAVDETEYFRFLVDSRLRLDPPLPITYFGNCLRPTYLEAKRSNLLGKDGMLIAAEVIGNAIQTIENGEAIFKHTGNFFTDMISISSSRDRVVPVAGATSLGTYDTDFGWGKPKKAEIVSITGTRAISLSECPSEVGAVEVGLARNISEMDAFASMFATTIQGFTIQ
ncbi:hypothetical protein ACHQM5_007431 [Ranunculus cassubicifolius]